MGEKGMAEQNLKISLISCIITFKYYIFDKKSHYTNLSNYVILFQVDAEIFVEFKGKIPEKFHTLTSIGHKLLILLF